MMAFIPIRFINQPVDVQFDQPQLLEKTPRCPDRFEWQAEQFPIVELISEWRDYRRQGRMARNMRPEHAVKAAMRGSWGVGQFYFRVRTQQGRIFDLYYDRAPKDVDRRKGAWFLEKELRDADT
jgi:hypothetical protein